MLTEERGYIVYSSMGSFFIPLAIIMFVYMKIFLNTRQRLRKRANASNLTALAKADASKQHHVAAAAAAPPPPPTTSPGTKVTLQLTVQEKNGSGPPRTGTAPEHDEDDNVDETAILTTNTCYDNVAVRSNGVTGHEGGCGCCRKSTREVGTSTTKMITTTNVATAAATPSKQASNGVRKHILAKVSANNKKSFVLFSLER